MARKGGYGIVYQEIMRNKSITPEAKAIYAYLCSFAGSGNTCYPGVELMRSELGMGADRFYKHMRQLVDAGVVIKDQERQGNRWGKTIYRISHHPDFQLSQNENTENESTHIPDTQNRTSNNISLTMNR